MKIRVSKDVMHTPVDQWCIILRCKGRLLEIQDLETNQVSMVHSKWVTGVEFVEGVQVEVAVTGIKYSDSHNYIQEPNGA